jgi:hypothetical protein
MVVPGWRHIWMDPTATLVKAWDNRVSFLHYQLESKLNGPVVASSADHVNFPILSARLASILLRQGHHRSLYFLLHSSSWQSYYCIYSTCVYSSLLQRNKTQERCQDTGQLSDDKCSVRCKRYLQEVSVLVPLSFLPSLLSLQQHLPVERPIS